MNTSARTPHVVLVPGHWLGAWAWEEVADRLTELGLAPHPVTLPGLDPADPERATRTLADQIDALTGILRHASDDSRRAVVVGHSGANGPLSVVLDRHPELVDHVIWVDSGPLSDGSVFSPDLDPQVVDVPLPDFDTLARSASLDGLDDVALERFRRRAVAEPGDVVRQAVQVNNPVRREVPTTLICCSITGALVHDLAAAGHPMFAEVAELRDVATVDLPTGHWPMWSRPRDLADLIGEIARGE